MQFLSIITLLALASFSAATYTDGSGKVHVRSLSDEDVQAIARAITDGVPAQE
jgi:hypothetical protein